MADQKGFDPAFIEEIKGMLLNQEALLVSELEQIGQKNEHNSDDFKANFPEFGEKEDEQSAGVAAYGDNLSLEHSLEKSLRDVRKALGAIDAGTYGICKYCEVPIPEDRLRARPGSGSCVECKTRLKGR
jgi:RNA polymerase-binding transcription factor DksA